MTGQAVGLEMVRHIVAKVVPTLFGHDVEHSSLVVSILGGNPKGIDLDFFQDIRVGVGRRPTAARSGEVGAVQ